MTVVASSFCAITSTRVLASIMSSNLHVQSSRVYLVPTLDIMHMIKCTSLSPFLAGRAWERSYNNAVLIN